MSVNIKVKYLVLFAFIFGCMSTLVVKDLSLVKDAVARGKEKCEYLRTGSYTKFDGYVTDEQKKLTSKGWKAKSFGGVEMGNKRGARYPYVLWERCKG